MNENIAEILQEIAEKLIELADELRRSGDSDCGM